MTDLDLLLNEGLAEGQPSDEFDAQLQARLRTAREAEVRALDALLDHDRPTPTPSFDARFEARLAAERPARVSSLRRRVVLGVVATLAAAAAVFLLLRPADEAPPSVEDLAMVAELDLLQHYDEAALLDGLEDPEIFALVAQLDVVERRQP